eukprot:487534-Ditylum_brightwellii.AAC.1
MSSVIAIRNNWTWDRLFDAMLIPIIPIALIPHELTFYLMIYSIHILFIFLLTLFIVNHNKCKAVHVCIAAIIAFTLHCPIIL